MNIPFRRRLAEGGLMNDPAYFLKSIDAGAHLCDEYLP